MEKSLTCWKEIRRSHLVESPNPMGQLGVVVAQHHWVEVSLEEVNGQGERILLNHTGGWVVRWCWANFQCRGVLLLWIRVGQGPSVLAVGAGGGCLEIFSLVYRFSFFLPLWGTARYRLKYCLKGPLSPKQPTNQHLLNQRPCVRDQCEPYSNREVRLWST